MHAKMMEVALYICLLMTYRLLVMSAYGLNAHEVSKACLENCQQHAMCASWD